MKKVMLTKLKTVSGEPFQVPTADGEKLEKCDDLRKLLQLLIFNLPRQSMTMEDSIRGSNLVRQMDGCKGNTLEIEEAEHDWIKKKVTEVAPMVFGINAVVVRDALDNFERLHEPKEKEPKKEE